MPAMTSRSVCPRVAQVLETSYQRDAIGLVLERPPEANGALPLADIRRNIRRMAALLQQQAPELFIEKRARQRLFDTPPDSPCSENSDNDINIDVFITEKLGGAPFPTPTETPMLFETLPLPMPQNPLSSRTDPGPGPSLPKIPRHKLPKYDNVRSSLDTKGSLRRSNERMDVVHRGGKPRFDDLKGTYNQTQPANTYQPNTARRFVQNDPYRPNAKSRIPLISESPPPPRRSEIPKLPPNPDRLKNLVSRDFSKPPEKRPDPRVQHLAKPMSPVKKPVDVFKAQAKVKMNQSMDTMMNMTNYGEAEKPDPYQNRPRAKPEEEDNKDKKKPFKLPKELQRVIAPKKLPPIAKPKPPTPSPTPPPPSPELEIPSIQPEESFVMVKEEFSDDEEEQEDAAVTDSAYCTCEEFTESEDYQSLITDDSALSGQRLEVCTNCGGKRSMRSSRVPSSIKEQSFIFGSRSSSGVFMEEEAETFESPLPPSSPPPPPLRDETPIVSPENVELELETDTEPEVRKDFMDVLDNIGKYKGIPDPEPELPPQSPVRRTVLAPIKRQKGNYANGVREAYIKALAAAEVTRLPADWSMMLGPRITRSWVFSYYDYVEPPKIKDPDAPPTPPPPPPPPTYLTDAEPKKKKKKKKKKFKPMKHIFGKVKPDTYFPGMKNNLVLTPIEVTTNSQEPVTMMEREKLDPVKEIPPGRFRQEDYEQEEVPATNFRLNRAFSRQSSCVSQGHQHNVL